MEFASRVENGQSVVSLSGRLDAVTSPVCEQKFRDLVGGGALGIVVYFENLEYISSAGLRALLLLAKLLKEKGGKVCLAGAKQNVRSVLEMSGFTNIFQIRDTVAEALTSVG